MATDDEPDDSFFRGLSRNGDLQRACTNVVITLATAIVQQAFSSNGDK